MRTPKVPEAQGEKSPRENKQLLMLGGLVLALGVVLVLQFSQGDGEAEAAAAAIAVDEKAVEAARAVAKASSAQAPIGNPVLSQPSAADTVNDEVFKSFWDVATPVESQIEELPPPSVQISATLTPAEGESGGVSLAVIDGRLRRVGDVIGGWSLESIRKREITLRSSTNRLVVMGMPVLDPGRLEVMARNDSVSEAAGETAAGAAASFTADAIAAALGGMLDGQLDSSMVDTLTQTMTGGVANGAVDLAGALKSLQVDADALNSMSAEELVPLLSGGAKKGSNPKLQQPKKN